MLERKFEYETFRGETVEETFCFHLSKSELTKWLTTNGDYTLDKLLIRMTEESRAKDILEIFDDLIRKSVGKVSVDGKRFQKSEEITTAFIETQAYDDLFMELISDGKKAAEFINAIIPADLSKDIEKILKDNPEGIPDELKAYIGEASVGA